MYENLRLYIGNRKGILNMHLRSRLTAHPFCPYNMYYPSIFTNSFDARWKYFDPFLSRNKQTTRQKPGNTSKWKMQNQGARGTEVSHQRAAAPLVWRTAKWLWATSSQTISVPFLLRSYSLLCTWTSSDVDDGCIHSTYDVTIFMKKPKPLLSIPFCVRCSTEKLDEGRPKFLTASYGLTGIMTGSFHFFFFTYMIDVCVSIGITTAVVPERLPGLLPACNHPRVCAMWSN